MTAKRITASQAAGNSGVVEVLVEVVVEVVVEELVEVAVEVVKEAAALTTTAPAMKLW
jgi:hypothetical protein